MTLIPAQIEFDSSGRLVSTAYGDIYFQPAESLAESDYVFLQQGGFYDALDRAGGLTVAETGFGTGLNFLLCAQRWKTAAENTANPERLRRDDAFAENKANPERFGVGLAKGGHPLKKRDDAFAENTKWLHYISFEKHPLLKADLEKIHRYWPELEDVSKALIDRYPLLTAGIHRLVFEGMRVTLTLALGDIRDTLPDMEFAADIWFLDGFAPARNPDMWSRNIIEGIARNTAPQGRVATFTAAGAVRRGLTDMGFDIHKAKGHGRKRDMLTGQMISPPPPRPFTAADLPPPPAPVRGKPVTIIGAGIAGCALAESLTCYGHKVTLIDKNNDIAAEASGNPLAAVYPKLGATDSIADRMYRAAFTYSEGFYRHLPDSSFNSCGVFIPDRDEDARLRHLKIQTRGLDPDLAHYIEQDNVTGLGLAEGGLWIPKGGTVSPPVLCRALLDKAESTGRLTITTGKTVTDLEGVDGPVILAAGTGVNDFAETAWLPLETVRGQVTAWGGNAASRALKTVICANGYIAPAYDGTHILGATFDKGAADSAAPLPENHVRNMKALFSDLPGLAGEYDADALSGRSGNRTAAPDRLPVFGAVIDDKAFQKDFAPLARDATTLFSAPPAYVDGLYVLGALGSHGMTTAPWLAECLAAHLSGQPLPMTRSLYNALCPARFAVRDLKRGT